MQGCKSSSDGTSYDLPKAIRSKLLLYEASSEIPEYEYTKLPADKKRIRLLRLLPGVLDSPQIDCEMFEGEFDQDGDLIIVGEDVKKGVERNSSLDVDSVHVPDDRKIVEEEGNDDLGVDSDEEEEEDVDDKEPAPKTPKPGTIRYEALSWRWGEEDTGEYTIMIRGDRTFFKKRVSQTLGLALKYLRGATDRILWIDAICINQKDLEERSYQVSMISLVYTGSKEVCVWLGEDDDDSTLAIQFIKKEIRELKNFDRLITDKEHARKWRALLVLMQRPWFSRRWVVQQIALATKATVYCGVEMIAWHDLAIAVELFVEVETATHRLSELMKKDEKSALVPYWFEHISELGASVLVNATARIFREHRRGGYGALTLTQEDQPVRRSLLSLEYLVTSLSIFDCGRPHDSVYALIAIARDAAPYPSSSITKRTEQALIAEVFSDALEQKPYPLDYSSSYPDVCKEFTQFCIRRCHKADPTQALDILCRPWAKDWRPGEFELPFPETKPDIERLIKHEDSWYIVIEGGRKVDSKTTKDYMEVAKRQLPQATRIKLKKWFSNGPKETDSKSSKASSPQGQHEALKSKKKKKSGLKDIKDLCLPSWVATIAGAPFDIFLHPGMDMVKMGRKNADPLVAAPQDGHRNYNASQSKKFELRDLQFRKRARLGHYSLYVKGFRFDKVEEVAQVSQSGAIPASWLDLAGWKRARRFDDPGDPPNEFWRTLVADRGMNDRNPPYYYMRACKETIMKGGLRSNAVDTTALIHNERNSIIAEFCRRVQAVIWNRALIKTKSGALGLVSENVEVGDWICIIYGCTVPVILRKGKWKTEKELAEEAYEDRIETLAGCLRNAVKRRARKARYKHKCEENPMWEKAVRGSLYEYRYNEDRRKLLEYKKMFARQNRNMRQISKAESESGLQEYNEMMISAEGQDNRVNSSKAIVSQELDYTPTSATAQLKPKVPPKSATLRQRAAQSSSSSSSSLTISGGSDFSTLEPDLSSSEAVPNSDPAPPNSEYTEAQSMYSGSNVGVVSNGTKHQRKSQPDLDIVDNTEEERSGDEEADKIKKTKAKTSGTEVIDTGAIERMREKRRQEVARKKDMYRHFRFLGEAYIHGMMDGEAVRQKFYKAKPDHVFEIR